MTDDDSGGVPEETAADEFAMSGDDLRRVRNEADDLWMSRPSGLIRFADSTQAQFVLTWALAHNVVRMSRAADRLLDDGLSIEAMPNVRACYESAITAQWLSSRKVAADAMMAEFSRTQRATDKALARAQSEILRQGAGALPYLEPATYVTGAEGAAQHFEQLCDELEPKGSDKYIYYRLMARYVHPSVALLDQYMAEPPPEAESPVKLIGEPRQLDIDSWRFFVAASAVWAMSAVDHVERGHPNEDRVREWAATLGIPPALALSREAALKDFESARTMRRADWKGPRKKDGKRTD